MKQEVDRCRMAIEEAVKGKPFPWYAAEMQVFTEWQGFIYELSTDYPPLKLKSFLALQLLAVGQQFLAAPLIHDFAVISLSDLLTPLGVNRNKTSQRSKIRFCPYVYTILPVKNRSDYLEKSM